jgi:hypothetical protein
MSIINRSELFFIANYKKKGITLDTLKKMQSFDCGTRGGTSIDGGVFVLQGKVLEYRKNFKDKEPLVSLTATDITNIINDVCFQNKQLSLF